MATLLMAVAAVLCLPATALAQSYEVLHLFTGGSDGGNPYASLIQATDGNFYGTAQYGGASGTGTVFKMDSAGNLTTLHSFTGSDGAYSEAGLIQATDGNFYGTTVAGGDVNGGAVFKMDLSGNLTLLHSFTGYAGDGDNPHAGLLQATDGNFYGTTFRGGANGYGTVFKMDSAGNLTLLHNFMGPPSDGAYPQASLIQATDGNFYGTASYGGASNYGTVFKMDSAGNLTLLHNFMGPPSDGAYPQASLIQATDGNFYSTTGGGGSNSCSGGCGTVFKMDSAGNLTTLYSFTGGADGAYPTASLIQATDGNFYGAAVQGGTGNGTVFKVDLAGNLTVLHSFTGSDGKTPFAGLLQATDGNFYGTAWTGGPTSGGVVFRFGLGCFFDVLPTDPFSTFICTVARDRITAGCGGGNYCPGDPVTRAQMAVLLLRAEHGSSYTPPACHGIFADVPCPGGFAVNWIEQLSAEGITAGCGGGNYCPADPVTRAQMAVFLLRTEHGSSYTPPVCHGVFTDAPCPGGFAADWIEQLHAEGVTGGCGGGNYCPNNPSTRAQMAVFLTTTFKLQ